MKTCFPTRGLVACDFSRLRRPRSLSWTPEFQNLLSDESYVTANRSPWARSIVHGKHRLFNQPIYFLRSRYLLRVTTATEGQTSRKKRSSARISFPLAKHTRNTRGPIRDIIYSTYRLVSFLTGDKNHCVGARNILPYANRTSRSVCNLAARMNDVIQKTRYRRPISRRNGLHLRSSRSKQSS